MNWKIWVWACEPNSPIQRLHNSIRKALTVPPYHVLGAFKTVKLNAFCILLAFWTLFWIHSSQFYFLRSGSIFSDHDLHKQTWAMLKAVTNVGSSSYFVAALAWLLLFLVLGFFVHVLDNVIDTVYVCYAIDRDRGEVCKQEVHEVYIYLPLSRNHGSARLSGVW